MKSKVVLNEAVFIKSAIPAKCACVLFLLFFSVAGFAAEENASDPLAKVRNTDVRWQYFDTDGSHINDVFIDELDLAALGFSGVVPESTERPAYHPATLL